MRPHNGQSPKSVIMVQMRGTLPFKAVGGDSGAEADFDACAGSQSNSLNLILGQPFLRAAVKLGGARAPVRRHFPRVFERANSGALTYSTANRINR
jgi:hypothetical protein